MLVIRRGLEVAVERLQPAGHAFLSSLSRLETLASACEAALMADPDADIPALLNHAVDEKILIGLALSAHANTHPGDLT